jgi:Ni2+-binding GTPase involved in maturation of urease and hydrogenase
MAHDASAVRRGLPVAFVSLRTGEGFDAVMDWTLEWLDA